MTIFSRDAATFCAMAAALLLSGCALWQPLAVPMRTIAVPAPCATPADTLLVLLPGSYSQPEEFEREGFVQAARDSRLAADLLLVDAHVGYYHRRVIVDRLQADVVAPARARGYRHIWLAGVSIGGLGAMLHAEARPGDVDGLLLLAPYLGTRLVAQDIANAGGLAAWRAPPFPVEQDLDAGLWRWLQQQTVAGQPPLWLGYGQSDRFAYNAEVLQRALPAAQVFTAPGGHDWPIWTGLWQRMLGALPIGRCGA